MLFTGMVPEFTNDIRTLYFKAQIDKKEISTNTQADRQNTFQIFL